jgi:lysyl-tRNA synthetase class I
MADTNINCPKCNRVVEKVTQFETSFLNPNFHCKCGVKGKLSWVRGGVVKLTKS